MKLYLNTDLLQYVSGTGATLFNPAVSSVDPSGSPIGVVAVGIKSTTSTSQVQGGAVPILTANLKVKSSAPLSPITVTHSDYSSSEIDWTLTCDNGVSLSGGAPYTGSADTPMLSLIHI